MYILDPRKGAKSLIEQKISEYLFSARLYRFVYYASRILTALASGLIPFVINSDPKIATALALTIVLCVAVDTVFDPKSNWRIHSKASDMLAIANLKAKGEYEKYKEQIEILRDVEDRKLEKLVDLDEVKEKVKKG